MAGDASFDVVSDFDEQELRNALDQVRREVQQRYDFKGVTVDLSQAKTELVLVTDDEYRASAVKDLIEFEGDPARPLAEDLRLGQGRACRRQQGPPGDHVATRATGRSRQEAHEDDPRRVSQGEVADPG